MKITDIEINENNVKSAPDTLNAEGEISVRDVKNVFDKLPELIAKKHNNLVDYVNTEVCTKSELKNAVHQEIAATSADDIAKIIYDSDDDGMVDNSKQLDGHTADYFATSEQGIHTYTHTTGQLTGTGTNGKFKATETGAYTAFTIDDVSYAVQAGVETEIELTSGVWYSFILDTSAKTINFKSGGGVSNSKLALATATEADVLSGKTFYSGNKELKTGEATVKSLLNYLDYTVYTTLTTPSSTTSTSVARTFTKGTLIRGLSRNNLYSASGTITNNGDGSFYTNVGSGYFCGFVLRDEDLKAGDNAIISFYSDEMSTHRLATTINFYQSSGAFIYGQMIGSRVVEVPDNAEYCVLLFGPVSDSGEQTISQVAITKI